MSAEILVTVGADGTLELTTSAALQTIEVASAGPEGPGAPRGGATNQVVAKASDADLDFKFVTLTPQFVGAEPAVTSGTTSDYWRGDKTWRNFFADVRAATLTGLSTAVNAVVTAADTVLSAIGKLQAQVTGLASSKLDVAATSFGGNAATATTLQTARTINGTSFNGSANITTANWGTARTLTIGSTGKSVNGSANVSWSLSEILGVGVPETAQELAGGVDLNTIQTPGFYLQSQNAEAASGTNYPAPLAGALMVLKNAMGVTQIYCTYGASLLFFRSYYGYTGEWSTWREVYHSGNLSAATASGAGIVELATVAEALAGTDASRAVTPQGLAAYAGALSFRNKLINAAFTINQRSYTSGAATTSANQYTLDRWRVVTSGQNLSWSGAAPNITITAPASGVEQVIEGIWIEGGTYTLSWTGTATATVNGSAVANGGQVALTAGANATVRFSGGTVSKPQLELGSYATRFEHRPLSLELMLCQRYYEAGRIKHWAIATSSSIALGQRLHFSVPKRASPTMTRSGVVLLNCSHLSDEPDQYGCGFVVSSNGSGGVIFEWNWAASAEL